MQPLGTCLKYNTFFIDFNRNRTAENLRALSRPWVISGLCEFFFNGPYLVLHGSIPVTAVIDLHQGRDTERTGPVSVEGTGRYPEPGSGLWDVLLGFNVQFVYANGVDGRQVAEARRSGRIYPFPVVIAC